MLTLDLVPINGIAIYSNIETKETYIELWGASTKHPDVSYCFSKYQEKYNHCSWLENVSLIYQWILECASLLSIPYHSYELASLANEIYATYRGWIK